MARKKKSEISKDDNKPKVLGIFDHVKAIKEDQSKDYYKNLNDADKKSFNHFMICKALSMNPDMVDDISNIFKYFDKIPSNEFYILLSALTPRSSRFYPWIKNKKKTYYEEELVNLIQKKYDVSFYKAVDYLNVLYKSESGKNDVKRILQGYGKDDKEIEKLMIIE